MDGFPASRLPLLSILLLSLIIPSVSAANDTIDTSQSITDGETLVSSGGVFELGFFGDPGNRYLGTWYKNISVRTYVWVANRQAPLTTNSGVLRIVEHGIVALFNHSNGMIIWSSKTTSSVQKPTARLLDTGNLVVKDANDDRPENFLWRSFDHPSDSLLPGMSVGWNLKTGVETYYTSWRSDDDPSPGQFTSHLDPTGYPQIVVRRLDAIHARSGPWNGFGFGGAPGPNGTKSDATLTMNKTVVMYGEETADPSFVSRIVLSPNGVIQRQIWNSRTNSWTTYTNMPADNCDSYNLCGANGLCTVENSPPCVCLDRFVPKDQQSWSSTDWYDGCVRRTPLNCTGDVFLKYSGIKMPDTQNSTFDDRRLRLEDCDAECKRNCSCVAYTQLDITAEAGGCLFYYGDLFDIRTISTGGQDLHIRLAYTESANNSNAADAKGKSRVNLIASLASAAGVVLLLLVFVVICTRKRNMDRNLSKEVPGIANHRREAELPLVDLPTILKATDNFSNDKKLGEGGFGPVYRGMLEDRQEIAVKRLSKTSKQGAEELMNEVVLIAKLQHRNMVRLLGCCVEGEENMLVYEYMPNSSLDLILFDQTKSSLLDWKKRFNIIIGIARGLLYLHQDSRLRIIHRDLKASNILLDADMNPKISDFGLARGFGGNETEAQTRRVVGTYGYMSPEYAIDGLFSIKSDVFSFGVLVLEVVSGRRNRGFSLKDHNLNLLGHAWTLYREDESCELVDTSLGDSYDISQAMRAIHVGLLCVQTFPDDRPSMSSVVFMLENQGEIPQAKQPGFFTERDALAAESSSNTSKSANQLTITLPHGR